MFSYTLVPVTILFSLNNSSLPVTLTASRDNLLPDFVIQAVPVYFHQIHILFTFSLHSAFKFLIFR